MNIMRDESIDREIEYLRRRRNRTNSEVEKAIIDARIRSLELKKLIVMW